MPAQKSKPFDVKEVYCTVQCVEGGGGVLGEQRNRMKLLCFE